MNKIKNTLLDKMSLCSKNTKGLCLKIDEHFTPLAKTLFLLHQSFNQHQKIIQKMITSINLSGIEEIEITLEKLTTENSGYEEIEIRMNEIIKGFKKNLIVIDKSLDNYTNIAKMLQIIKVNMDIKNASVKNINFDLSDLLEDIENLSKNIIINAEAIKSTGEIVKGLLQGGLTKTQKNTTSKNNSNITYTDICDIINNIRQISNNKKNNMLNMEQDIKKTIDDISNITVKFQYADIIKQRLEHVAETIDNLEKKIEENPNDSNLKLAYQESELQFLQMNDIDVQIKETHTTLTNSLNHINDVKDELYNTAKIEHNSDENNIIIQMNLLLEKADIVLKLSENILKEEKETSDKATIIYNQIDKIKDRLTEIRKIGNVTQVVALNSQFKVQKLNNEGKSLYELSRIILTEAEKMKKTTEILSYSIQEIINFAEELKNINQNKLASQVTMEENLLKKIDKFHEKIKEQEKLYRSKMEELNSSTIEDDMTYFILILNSNEQILEDIQTTLINLKEISQIIDQEKKFSLNPHESKKIEEIRTQYTMDHEREIHKRFLNEKDEANNTTESNTIDDDDNIELF